MTSPSDSNAVQGTRDDDGALPRAWSALLAEADRAGQALTDLPGLDDADIAEARRFVLRVLSVATETIVEQGDPHHPEFVRVMNNHRKFFFDNPDTNYDSATISGDIRY